MAGHQYGQFGPAPGGPPPGGTAPIGAPPVGPSRGGPYGWPGKLLCCLAPLLTLGLLGLVPSLLLALRRRRAIDVAGAVVFGLITLTAFVGVGLLPDNAAGTPASSAEGGVLILLWLGAPVHFLVLDSRRFWGLAGPVPTPFVPVPAQQPAAWHQPTLTDTPAPAPDDLQQLGELLRRQVQDRRP